MEKKTLIRLGHSPDADDAFMFYGLASGKVETGNLVFEHLLRDIETLNQWALEGRLEVTAISVHAYPYVAGRYALLPSGASMGEDYGPIVVTREPEDPAWLWGRRIAVPGRLTTATLALHLYLDDFEPVIMPFDTIMEAVRDGRVDAGLIIHEGQLSHGEWGLHPVADLGKWWRADTGGLPLPLGVNAVRRDLGGRLMADVSRYLRESIEYALAHREDALTHALRYARGLDRDVADRFVGMYVNERTVDMGADGREAIALILKRGHERGLVPAVPELDFVPQA